MIKYDQVLHDRTGWCTLLLGYICLISLKLVSVDESKVLSCSETERSSLQEIQQLHLFLFAPLCGEAEENP